MNAFPVLVNRLVALVVGAALLVVGGGAIAWELDVTWVRERVADVDESWFDRAPDQSWWIWLLIGVAAGAIVIGLGILVLDARPRRTGTTLLGGSDGSGTLTLNPAKLAAAVADQLADEPALASARARAVDDRRRRLLEVTVTAEPRTDFADVLDAVARCEQTLAGALDGSDLRPRFLVQMRKNSRPSQRVR